MDSLSRDLVKSFAEVVNEPKQKEPVRYVRGTITGKGDAKYVQLDGSTVATPISEVVDAQEGDRVLVSIENHRAVIVGNFTFSPSARQEQEALEKAEGAENTANSAGETANAAQLAAQEASKNANEAMGAASAASSSAAEAKDQAADAMVAAGNAQASANEAKESATQANENATQAKTDAANAQAAVANANEEIGKINDAIETAQGDIDEALDNLHSQADEINVIKRDYSTKVETENVKAELSTQITESVGQLQTTIQENYYTKNDIVEIQGNLQSQITQNAEGLSSQATKIESLESDTAEAQKQVDQALEKAESAQQAATQAKQDAEAATEAAETAQTEAATAAEKAQNANDAALDAKLAAHVADKALADAREALDQARENYKNVVSNPGSTAEDIASAAAQVETARQAVETALEDAAEAQYVANKAQEAADVAQEEANAASQAAQTAQNKADAAEQAANNAQAAAEQAAENVAALTKRVTTAETKIDQNAEQISLNATKTEEIGDKLVNDYYSKTETDALIKVESDRITSTVSKVETVEKTAITSTIEEFYLSSSPTSLSGGSWVTTQPTWTQGKYIWRRTKVTKGDGTTSYSPSQNGVCITGNTGATGAQGPQGEKGDTGATGATGNGISKTEVYYYLSTSNTTQSGGSWSTTVPAWIDGRYYWQKIKTTYTNGNSSESTPVCITGGKGATGATGNTGATGKGVSSITIEFYLSNSKTTQSGGSWTTTMPTWTSGKYLWTRNKIVYTNPASTVYTTPICDSSWEAVNEIEVGGRNLLRLTKTFELPSNIGTSSINIVDEMYKNFKVRGTNNAPVNSASMIYAVYINIPVEKGDVFTFSFYAKGTVSNFYTFFYGPNNYLRVASGVASNGNTTTSGDGAIRFKPTSEWQRFWVTYILYNDDSHGNPSFGKYILIRSDGNTVKNASLYICGLKLEKGNKATDWTPAPEDIENDISQIETRITSAEQKITDDAIVSTVRKSTLYKNDLNGKVNSTEIISTINQTAEAIKIQASKIKLEGLVTANSYFKILTNGSIEAVNGKFTGTITATSGTIGGWTIQKDSLTCVSHNDGFNVTYTTYIDANNGLIKFLSTSNDYETIISINGMEMHAGRQDGDRWIYDDIYYGVNGISKSGTMTGETFSLNANGVSFGLTHNLVSWINGGGYLSTNDEVNIGNNCRASSFYSSNNIRAGGGNENTLITSNWIGFYRASDGGRVGWMGANGTNDLYISPEKGTCYIGSNLYVASNADRWGYYLQFNSGGGTYAGNGYIFVNSSNGYLALGQGDAYVGSSGGRLYLKPQNQVTYDMFVEPRANRKTTLGSSDKRFYRLYTGLAVDVSSDRRIKEDFTTFDDRYLRLFELLQPTIYKLKYLPEDKSKIGGFIAQDVEEAMKQCGIDKREFGIYKYDSENDEYSLIYDMFIPLTVHYVQEQSKLVNHLKNEVALLKSKINI